MPETARQIEPRATPPERHEQPEAWLISAASRVAAEAAALFVRHGKTAKNISCFPEQQAVDDRLVAAARDAFRAQRVFYRSEDPDSKDASIAYIGLSLRIRGRPAAVAFKLRASVELDDQEHLRNVASLILRRAEDSAVTRTFVVDAQAFDESAHLDAQAPVEASQNAEAQESAPPAVPAQTREPEATPSPASPDRVLATATRESELVRAQSAVIISLAAVLDHSDFRRSLHALAEAVAHQWQCLRVVVGIEQPQGVAVEAVSGVVDFDPSSAAMVDIGQVLEETRSAARVIVLPSSDKSAIVPPHHVALAAQLNEPALMSVPLVDSERVVGAVLLERDRAFSEVERHELEQMALLVAPVIALKKLEAMGPADRFVRYARARARALFGTKGLGWKLGGIAGLALLLFGALLTTMFKVGAEARIEANVHRAVVASFPSFLTQVEKRAGDIVYQGDVLAQLDVEELQLDRVKWVGEQDKLTKEYRATLAQRDRSNVRILEAQRAQAQSQIDLLDSQIARATLRAPIDGVVVAGDLSQSLGSPVERGELLFEVASLDDYRLVLMVDESDIGWVEVGRRGNLRLRSLPEESFPFTVSAITPVSEPGEGANRFRVEASFERSSNGIRPGMGGVAKIDIEPRSIGWIWTRSFVNWLRFQLWKFGW